MIYIEDLRITDPSVLEIFELIGIRSDTLLDESTLRQILTNFKNTKYCVISSFLRGIIEYSIDNNCYTLLDMVFNNKEIVDILEHGFFPLLIYLLRQTLADNLNMAEYISGTDVVSVNLKSIILRDVSLLKGFNSSNAFDLVLKHLFFSSEGLDIIFNNLAAANCKKDAKYLKDLLPLLINDAVLNNDINMINQLFFDEKRLTIILKSLNLTDFISFIKNSALKNCPEMVERILSIPDVEEKFRYLDNDPRIVKIITSFDMTKDVHVLLLDKVLECTNLFEFLSKSDEKNDFYKFLKEIRSGFVGKGCSAIITDLLYKINNFLQNADSSIERITLRERNPERKIASPVYKGNSLSGRRKAILVINQAGDYCSSSIDDQRLEYNQEGEKRNFTIPIDNFDGKCHHINALRKSLEVLKYLLAGEDVADFKYPDSINRFLQNDCVVVSIEGNIALIYFPKIMTSRQYLVFQTFMNNMKVIESNSLEDKIFILEVSYNGQKVNIGLPRDIRLDDMDRIIGMLYSEDSILDSFITDKNEDQNKIIIVKPQGNILRGSDATTLLESEYNNKGLLAGETDQFISSDSKLDFLARKGTQNLSAIRISPNYIILVLPEKLSSSQESFLDNAINKISEYENSTGARFRFTIVCNDNIIDKFNDNPIFTENIKPFLINGEIVMEGPAYGFRK